MRHPIVCGVDGTDRSPAAVGVAADLAERLGRELVVVHVVERPGDRGDLREAACEVAEMLDLSPEVELRAVAGDPAESLRALTEEEQAAMLVVASRGRGPILSALFGSVTAALMEEVRCPLLVVPPDAGAKYRRAAGEHDATVVCGIDGSAPVDAVVPVADQLARVLDADLLITHSDLPAMSTAGASSPIAGVGVAGLPLPLPAPGEVESQEKAARERLEQARALAVGAPHVEVRAELGDLAVSMTHIAEQPGVQLLVIAHGSPWQRLAARAGCPVLVVPPGRIRGAPRLADGQESSATATRTTSA